MSNEKENLKQAFIDLYDLSDGLLPISKEKWVESWDENLSLSQATYYFKSSIKWIAGYLGVDKGIDTTTLTQTFLKFCEDHKVSSSRIWEEVNEGVASRSIRRDWAASLSKVEKGYELSGKVDYGFSPEDIKNLAILHKESDAVMKEKIEDLLEDCNFHEECGDFSEGNYDKYIEAPGLEV